MAATGFRFALRPPGGPAGSPSAAFTLALVGGTAGSDTSVALSDGGAGGAFYPASPAVIAAGQTTRQFVYLPAGGASGTVTITATATGGITATQTAAYLIQPASTGVSDAFTGGAGNLSAHTADTLATWAKSTGVGGNVSLDGAGKITAAATAYYQSSVQAGPDVDVSASWVFGDADGGQIGVTAACNTSLFASPASGLDGYWLVYDRGTDLWNLLVFPAGTALATGPATLSAGTFAVRLAVRQINGSQYLFPLVDGLLVTAVVNDATRQCAATSRHGLIAATGGADAFDSFAVTAPPPAVSVAASAAAVTAPREVWEDLALGGALSARLPCDWLAVAVTGTTQVSLAIDLTANLPLGAAEMPIVRTRVGDRPWVVTQLAPGQTLLALATGLSAGTTYQVRVQYRGAGIHAADGWTTRLIDLKVYGLVADAGATFSAPALRPLRALFLTDSYGYYLGASVPPYAPAYHPDECFPEVAAAALQAEPVVIALGGSGYLTAAGDAGYPAGPSYWNYYGPARPRSFATAFDYVFLAWGYNDHGEDCQAACAAMLVALRAQFPAAFIVVTPPPSKEAPQAASILAAVRAAGDTRVLYCDPDPAAATAAGLSAGLTSYPTPTDVSPDGIHPDALTAAWLGAGLAARVLGKTKPGARGWLPD